MKKKKAFKSIIFNNIVSSMIVLVEACGTLGISIGDDKQDLAKKICKEEYFTGEFTQSIADDISSLWKDEGIRNAFAQSKKFQLFDSAEYYFNAIDRISRPEYVPNEQDILRSRAKTTGIIETDFTVGSTKFILVDVGGQRSERRKWMHCFQDVTAVIFCVALSDYDLKLYEDETTNRMQESLKLFKDICSTKWFLNTAIILFLNKKDVFQAKIKHSLLTECFPDYTGGNNFEEASQFIEDKFLQCNTNPAKLIYVHFTQATDTNNVTVVFKAVQDILLNRVLDKIL